MWLSRRQGLHSIIMYLMHNLQIITDFKFNSSCRDKISLWCAIWIYTKNNKTVIFSSTATQVLAYMPSTYTTGTKRPFSPKQCFRMNSFDFNFR